MNYKELELIKSGIRFFGIRGFDNFNVRELEEDAQVARGSVFELFETTEKFSRACFSYVMDSLMESNREFVLKLDSTLNFKEMSRKVWFNTLGWWLSHPECFAFYTQFRNSRYYSGDKEFVYQMAIPYLNFIEKGKQTGDLKMINTDFIYEMAATQAVNSVGYIIQSPNLMGDEEFLGITFDTLWDAVRIVE
ncbi:MAG: hypothetical protein R3277_03590 [Brumimicrobium sp.]|nr:hypothetical protein [Brumimicrobium sp.]